MLGELIGAAMQNNEETTCYYETLRRRYRPNDLRILFIGESRPACGTFFFAADSNLFLSTEAAFRRVYGECFQPGIHFLNFFRSVGCYLEDLCLEPVNNLASTARRAAHRVAINHLANRLDGHHPHTIIVVGRSRSLCRSVGMALTEAGLQDVLRFELPFPAMSHQTRYISELSALIGDLRSKGLLPL